MAKGGRKKGIRGSVIDKLEEGLSVAELTRRLSDLPRGSGKTESPAAPSFFSRSFPRGDERGVAKRQKRHEQPRICHLVLRGCRLVAT